MPPWDESYHKIPTKGSLSLQTNVRISFLFSIGPTLAPSLYRPCYYIPFRFSTFNRSTLVIVTGHVQSKSRDRKYNPYRPTLQPVTSTLVESLPERTERFLEFVKGHPLPDVLPKFVPSFYQCKRKKIIKIFRDIYLLRPPTLSGTDFQSSSHSSLPTDRTRPLLPLLLSLISRQPPYCVCHK